MHDVLEGAVPFEIKELLKHLIAEKTITLTEINNAICSFPYSFADAANKPGEIEQSSLRSRDDSLKQTGNFIT